MGGGFQLNSFVTLNFLLLQLETSCSLNGNGLGYVVGSRFRGLVSGVVCFCLVTKIGGLKAQDAGGGGRREKEKEKEGSGEREEGKKEGLRLTSGR
jgi:hypothetical protein